MNATAAITRHPEMPENIDEVIRQTAVPITRT